MFELSTKKEADVTIVEAVGRMDVATSMNFIEPVTALISGGERKLVYDFSKLEYLSSAGLRALLMSVKQMTAAGGKIVICSLQDYIHEVFEIAGFGTLFEFFPTVDEGLASLKGFEETGSEKVAAMAPDQSESAGFKEAEFFLPEDKKQK